MLCRSRGYFQGVSSRCNDLKINKDSFIEKNLVHQENVCISLYPDVYSLRPAKSVNFDFFQSDYLKFN
jgi:hypothetical protein